MSFRRVKALRVETGCDRAIGVFRHAQFVEPLDDLGRTLKFVE